MSLERGATFHEMTNRALDLGDGAELSGGPLPDREGPFGAFVRMAIKEGHRAEAHAIIKEILDLDATEPATVLQAVHVAHDDPNVVWIYELWPNRAALEEHRRTGRFLRDRIKPFWDPGTSAEWHFCTPLFSYGIDFEELLGRARQ